MSCLVAMQQLHTLLARMDDSQIHYLAEKQETLLYNSEGGRYRSVHDASCLSCKGKKRLRAVWWPQATKWIGSILRCQESHTHPYAALLIQAAHVT